MFTGVRWKRDTDKSLWIMIRALSLNKDTVSFLVHAMYSWPLVLLRLDFGYTISISWWTTTSPSNLWLPRFNRTQIIMGNSISMVHNHHLHQGPGALQELFLRWLTWSYSRIPGACIMISLSGTLKSSCFSHCIIPHPWDHQSHQVYPAIWSKQQGLSCSELHLELAVTCSHSTQANVLLFPEANKANPECWASAVSWDTQCADIFT